MSADETQANELFIIRGQLLTLSNSVAETRKAIVKDGSAKVLEQFDTFVRQFEETKKVCDTAISGSNALTALIGGIVLFVPWCYGIYKMIS